MLKTLQVVLTESEVTEKGKKAARLNRELTLAKEAKKAAADQHKVIVDDIQARRDKLLEEVDSGYENRAVNCKVNKRFGDKEVDIIRMDTGEIVETKPMTPEDLQLKLSKDTDDTASPPKPEVDQIWQHPTNGLCKIVDITEVAVVLQSAEGIHDAIPLHDWPRKCVFASAPIKPTPKRQTTDDDVREQDVLDVMTHEPMRLSDILEAMGDVDKEAVKRILRRLVGEERVVKDGKGAGTTYAISEDE